jgi:acyl-CoA synthetase (AMP-forming)/AMP-acid ligase II
MNVCELFNRSLACHAARVALVEGVGKQRRAVSYAALDRMVNSAAAELRNSGLLAGDRVLLAVPMSIETYAVMLALLRCGMVTMVIDPAHGAANVARILRAWPPSAVVATRSLLLLRFLVPELRRIPRRFVVGKAAAGARRLSFADSATPREETIPRATADSALLTFTSGSTGEPKPVVRTHGFLRHQLDALKPVARNKPRDIDFVAMPMFVLFNLANGITSILPACDMKHPGRANARIIAGQLAAEAATRMVASPALLDRLATWCRRQRIRFPALSTVSTGGGPISPDLPAQVKRIAPAATVRMVYGSTEAEPIACIDDQDVSVTAIARMRDGGGLLAGQPVADCDVCIVETDGNAPLRPMTGSEFASRRKRQGQVGEILVRGRHVLTTYADRSHNRATKVQVDDQVWHRTGDAGYFDAAGRLWLVGRLSAAITDDRGSVYPFQVEYALSGIPGIRRSALIQRGGQRVLVLEVSGREFQSRCAAAAGCISRHHIDRIITVRHIPVDRRHDAKVDYGRLQRILDGRWPRTRLWLAETVSATFRRVRGGWRRLAASCHSPDARTKVGKWSMKTER